MDSIQIFETAPLGAETILLTVLICAMFLLVGAIPVFAYRIDPGPGYLVAAVFTTPLLYGMVLACFLSVPRGYVIEPDRIVIRRLIADVTIDCGDIAGVEETGSFMWQGKGGLNSGVFGYAGTFRSESFGRFSAYLTNWKYLVTITRRSGRPVMISPDHPGQFVRSIGMIMRARGVTNETP